MWNEIYRYINKNNIDALFGTASFLDTNINKIEDQLIYLNNNHKMSDNIKVNALANYKVKVDYEKQIDINLKLE